MYTWKSTIVLLALPKYRNVSGCRYIFFKDQWNLELHEKEGEKNKGGGSNKSSLL